MADHGGVVTLARERARSGRSSARTPGRAIVSIKRNDLGRRRDLADTGARLACTGTCLACTGTRLAGSGTRLAGTWFRLGGTISKRPDSEHASPGSGSWPR
jgi:hypothetical protein